MEVVKVKETTRGLGVRIVRMMKNMVMKLIIMMSKIEERMVMKLMTNLMSNCEEGEVYDEKDDLVAEQHVGHEGDQGKPDWMQMMVKMLRTMRKSPCSCDAWSPAGQQTNHGRRSNWEKNFVLPAIA